MTRYDITLAGCDDSTYLIDVELTDVEHAALVRVAELATLVGGGCKPVMRVLVAPDGPPEGDLCTNCWERLDGTPTTRASGEWVHQACPTDTTTPEGA